MSLAYLALGSNIRSEDHIRRAVTHFAARRELSAVSTFYRTRPHEASGPPFVNGVIAIEPRHTRPDLLMEQARELERALGRKRGPDKNAPRSIDVDLIAWPGATHPRLPHQDISRYDFVARPLAELHPRLLAHDGRPVLDVARSMLPHGMTPLGPLTRDLRILLQRSKRSMQS